MTIILPPNSTGTTLETRTLGGRDRQLIGVGEPIRLTPSRGTSGRVIYKEDGRGIRPGVWNDGLGWAMSDCDITLNNLPSIRLDTGGNTNAGAVNPLRTAITSGVVAKRRLHDNYTGKWGVEFWFRMTSLNLTTNSLLSHSIYNRNGTQAHHFRVWLDPNGNNQPMVARILDGSATAAANGGTPTLSSGPATYTSALTSSAQNGAGSHSYDPATGRLDLAGGWHFCKMVVDFATLKYVSLQLDSQVVDLSAYNADVTDTTGFAGMHHSWEFSAGTSTRRYVNIANIIGTLED